MATISVLQVAGNTDVKRLRVGIIFIPSSINTCQLVQKLLGDSMRHIMALFRGWGEVGWGAVTCTLCIKNYWGYGHINIMNYQVVCVEGGQSHAHYEL